MRPKSGHRLPRHARASPRATIGRRTGGVASPSNPQHGRPLASQSAGDVPDHVIAPTITSAADDVARPDAATREAPCRVWVRILWLKQCV